MKASGYNATLALGHYSQMQYKQTQWYYKIDAEKRMRQISMHEVQANLANLVEQAANGEPFIIAKSGKPLVTVSAYTPLPDLAKRLGFLKGRLAMPEDFDSMGRKEIQGRFENVE